MRIGRDHLASTAYLIAFAYAGAALPTLLLITVHERPLLQTLTSAEIAEDLVRTLVGSIGLVLAIPLTPDVTELLVLSSQPRTSRTADDEFWSRGAQAGHAATDRTGSSSIRLASSTVVEISAAPGLPPQTVSCPPASFPGVRRSVRAAHAVPPGGPAMHSRVVVAAEAHLLGTLADVLSEAPRARRICPCGVADHRCDQSHHGDSNLNCATHLELPSSSEH